MTGFDWDQGKKWRHWRGRGGGRIAERGRAVNTSYWNESLGHAS
jgi:hypothetical protein